MQLLRVRHLTRYRYARPVRFGEHRMMLRPREHPDQTLLGERLVITPEPRELSFIRDEFGNWIGLATFEGEASELCIESEVKVARRPGEGWTDLGPATPAPRRPEPPQDPRLPLADWARGFLADPGAGADLEALAAMTRSIHSGFAYRRRLEHGVQPPFRTLALRSGACRDFAVLMIAAARELGLRARFVSGHVHCPEPTGGRPRRPGGGHTHAWASIETPGHGWVDFDPTSGGVGGHGLVRVAIADDPSGAVPVQGVYFGAASDFLGMDVEVEVASDTNASSGASDGEPQPFRRVAWNAA